MRGAEVRLQLPGICVNGHLIGSQWPAEPRFITAWPLPSRAPSRNEDVSGIYFLFYFYPSSLDSNMLDASNVSPGDSEATGSLWRTVKMTSAPAHFFKPTLCRSHHQCPYTFLVFRPLVLCFTWIVDLSSIWHGSKDRGGPDEHYSVEHSSPASAVWRRRLKWESGGGPLLFWPPRRLWQPFQAFSLLMIWEAVLSTPVSVCLYHVCIIGTRYKHVLLVSCSQVWEAVLCGLRVAGDLLTLNLVETSPRQFARFHPPLHPPLHPVL